MRAVGTWISRLINPDQLPVNPDDTSPSVLPPQKEVFRQFKQSNQRDLKRQKSESLGVGVSETSVSNGATPAAPDVTPPPFPPPVVPSGTGVYTSPPVTYIPATYGPLLPASQSQSKEVHYLPRFNERCAQQKLALEYLAENYGSPHQPKWVVKCMGEPHDCSSLQLLTYHIFVFAGVVIGIHKGTGQGSSKQVAKEEAAKQAFFNMGWI